MPERLVPRGPRRGRDGLRLGQHLLLGRLHQSAVERLALWRLWCELRHARVSPGSVLLLVQLAVHCRARWCGHVLGLSGRRGTDWLALPVWVWRRRHVCRMPGRSPVPRGVGVQPLLLPLTSPTGRSSATDGRGCHPPGSDDRSRAQIRLRREVRRGRRGATRFGVADEPSSPSGARASSSLGSPAPSRSSSPGCARAGKLSAWIPPS